VRFCVVLLSCCSAAAQPESRLAPVSHEGVCQSLLRRQKEEKEWSETAKNKQGGEFESVKR
jgi:hypothetical protein